MPRRRRRRTSRLEMFYAVLLIGALLGGSMWLDQRGTVTIGRVTEKHEEVTVHSEPSGGWSRRFRLGVGFATSDQGTLTEVTSARVEAVQLVTKSPARSYGRRRRSLGGSERFRRLAIPYQVVEMRVAVPGTADSVLAVDAVDSGSVAGLAAGAVLEVRQAAGEPREARLVQGTRRFVERNRYHALPGVAVIAVLGTALAVTASRKRRARAPAHPGHEAIRQPSGR
jgi:hypothetical protein